MKVFSRTITVLFPKKLRKQFNKRYLALYLRDFLFLVLLLLIGVMLQLLVYLHARAGQAEKNYEAKMKEYQYWTSVSNQFPNVPDILYNAALSSLKAGKKDEARKYVGKAIEIDPLFEKAKQLEKELNKRS